MQPIPVILTGFGQWVRNRTVVPLLKQYPNAISIAVVTSVKKDEFDELIRPTFEENGWEVPRFIPDLEDALGKMYSAKKKPVAVILTTPNGLHFDEARTAIEAGYHVYVERPIVTKNDPLPALIELAERQKVLFFTGTQRRLESPFQYLRKVVAERYEFGELRRIRCRFAAKHCLKGWRRIPDLSGGGVITDSGYHLLDIVAWLVNAISIQIPDDLEGAVRLGFDEPFSSAETPVETEAFGHIELPNQILLTFDFSYNAPQNSIFEQIEVYDQDFARVSLTRDQAVRTPLPATITHQLPKGQFLSIKTGFDQGIRAEAIRFAGEAQNTEPLRMFIEAVQHGFDHIPAGHILEARNSLSTWRLVREVYRLALKNHH